MLTSRGQENLIQARPTAGKALAPKTPSNFQTPRTTNRAPLGAKTTNTKAQTIFRDKENAKFQPFKTPAPGQQRTQQPAANKPSTTQRSGRSKIKIAPAETVKTSILAEDSDDDEPEYGYAPPPPVELPDPPMEFGYDQSFPQFRPENMFRGYGQIYFNSPKDENGMSIRLQKEEREYEEFKKQQEQELLQKIQYDMSKPLIIDSGDDEDEFLEPTPRPFESKPATIKAKSAAAALSSFKVPSVATKQTASSRLKINKAPPVKKTINTSKKNDGQPSRRPLSVSKNTIGFPKARQPPSIIPQPEELLSRKNDDDEDDDMLIDKLSDHDIFPPVMEDEEEVFQLQWSD